MVRKVSTSELSIADKAARLQQLGFLGAPKAGSDVPLSVKVERLALDAIADVGDFAAKAGAAAISSWGNARDSFALERARQQARRVERVYAAAQSAGLVS